MNLFGSEQRFFFLQARTKKDSSGLPFFEDRILKVIDLLD